MNGWAGRVLRVNLSNGESVVEDLDTTMAIDYIGGRGFGVKVLYDELSPTVEPLSAENKLIFAASMLAGTGAPTTCRHVVATKSPLTGGIAFSNSGGPFSAELKYAGYDILIVEGKASEPVYIFIEDDRIEIRPAKHIWGKGISETERMVKSEADDKWKTLETQVNCIGPAGENLVRMAAISNDEHLAARGGVGAVMGSKNLKAIAVRGTGSIFVADPLAFKDAVTVILEKFKTHPDLLYLSFLTDYGSLIGLSVYNMLGILNTRNFLEGSFEGTDKIDAEALKANFLVRNFACFGCPIACLRATRVKTEEFDISGCGPELETVGKLGANCGIDDLSAIVRANYICNDLGMDTMSVGGTISTAMELYEKGYLPEKDVGYKLNFGNAEAMVALVEKMAYRRDFGDILAEGGYRLAEEYGHPELFMGVKKQEFPIHHVQALQGTGLEFAVSNRGACHSRASMYAVEYSDQKFSLEVEGKAALCIEKQSRMAVIDASGMCIRSVDKLLEDVLPLMEAAVGVPYTLESVMMAGERMWNVERLFNLGAGLTASDDTLPRRILEEPRLKDWAEGQVNRLDEMLPEYYKLRGWDDKGVPTQKKLTELGISV